MKNVSILVASVLVLFSIGLSLSDFSTAATPATQTSSEKGFLSLLPKELQEQCGLSKLSKDELGQLNRVFSLFASNQAADLSRKYLESQGWQEVEIMGRTTVKENNSVFSEIDVVIIRGLGSRKYFTGSGLRNLAKGPTMANGSRRIDILDSSGYILNLRQVDVEE